MKLAIMQPYFMPYLGYWQLINVVDRFVLLDNVNFIKQGYINRNSILSSGKSSAINIQINGISSNKLILEHELNRNPIWKKKLLKTIVQNYSKAPFINDVLPIINDVINCEELNLSTYLANQMRVVSAYLGITTEIVDSSVVYDVSDLKGEERVVAICKQAGASTYINSIGGKDLYSQTSFLDAGVDLKFIEMNALSYSQLKNEFVSNLSIIDVMMFNSKDEIKKMLSKFDLR